MTFLPSVIRADYRGGFRIHLTFNDHSERTIDSRQWREGPVFEPFKDTTYFREFFVDGGTVVWPNGADVAPETLYEAAASRRRPNQRLQATKARARSGRPARLRRRG